MNEHHEAIRILNQVRFTGEWGLQATEHMVEIYLAPDSPELWADDADVDDKGAAKDILEACKVADKLLRDIPASSRVRSVSCACLCASWTVEAAVQRCGHCVT